MHNSLHVHVCLIYKMIAPLHVYHLLIEMNYERGNPHEFTSLVRELAPPGDLTTNKTFEFEFVKVEKPYESYTGANVVLR